MLWEEMEKYTKLTGEDATHVPIMKLGAYLDGYDKGIELIDKIRAEIVELRSKQNVGMLECLDIIDKYKGESGENE